jgi:hypothetical protein
MRATEHQFNTPEQVEEYLRQALDIVNAVEPPEDLRGICFAKAVDLVSNKQVFFDQPAVLPALRPH